MLTAMEIGRPSHRKVRIIMSLISPSVVASPATLLSGYSLEITTKDADTLQDAATLIPQRTAISVTFLPGESMEARVAAAAAISRLGFIPVPHIAARRFESAAELERFLARLQGEARADRCFVIAGDTAASIGPYADALAVIRSGLLERYGMRTVGIGGYPEGHPTIAEDRLWGALLDKTAALRSAGLECEIITQFGFDSGPVLVWLKQVRDAGINTRVRIGLPGPTNVRTLLRFAARCGVGASASVLQKYGISITRLIGVSGPDRLLEDLGETLRPPTHGDVGLHLYSFGGLHATARWAIKAMR